MITEEVSDKKVLTETSDEGSFLAVTDPVTAEIRTEDVSGGAQHATAQRADVLPAEAEEAADKKEEQDKQIEEAQEKRKNQEEIIEGQQNADQLEQDVSMQKQNTSKMDEAQKNIQKILKEKNLVNEDLKGIEIDLNF